MRWIVLTIILTMLGVSATGADEKKPGPTDAPKIDAAHLIGKWEFTKGPAESLPKGTIVEFTKETMMLTLELNNKKHELKGKYTIQGDKLRVTLKVGEMEGKEQIDTIKTLTADTLILIVEKGELEFTKVK